MEKVLAFRKDKLFVLESHRFSPINIAQSIAIEPPVSMKSCWCMLEMSVKCQTVYKGPLLLLLLATTSQASVENTMACMSMTINLSHR